MSNRVFSDVVVIGGGPVGSHLAYRLVSMGHEVVVVEQKEKLGEPVCCTGIISQECVDSFSINRDVIFRQVSSARIFSPSGKSLNLRRNNPQACVVNRSAFNESLANRAQSVGVEYVLGSKVNSLDVNSEKVCLEVLTSGGEADAIESKVAVIATGFSSNIIKGFGRFDDSVAGVQAEVETNGVDEVEVYMGQEIAPGFFAWLVPTLPQKALVGLLSRRTPQVFLKRLMASLMDQGKIVSDYVPLTYGGISLKPVSRSYNDRVIAVGTAAGQIKPTTGGGIYYGLLCADIAAENLHYALVKDDFSAKNLSNYEKSWKKKLGRELRIGYQARKFYELLSDQQIDKIFDIMKNNGIDEAISEADDLTFDWHGRVILKLIGYKAVTKAFGVMKIPFSLKGK
ncbi:NAD(P)/FAD-dependent oxidoreductase [Chloroflexota bacterium]